jgi:hypothetical protein
MAVDLPLPWDERWPHGKAFLVPRRGVIVSASRPITVNGVPARAGRAIGAGDVIAPVGPVDESTRLVIEADFAPPRMWTVRVWCPTCCNHNMDARYASELEAKMVAATLGGAGWTAVVIAPGLAQESASA